MGDDNEEAPPGQGKSRGCTFGPLESFKQQRLLSCVMMCTPCPLTICFVLMGLLAFLLGAIFVISSIFVQQTEVYRYDTLCDIGDRCTFRFEIEEDMKKPVYFYYRLESYYQNHRGYKDSRSTGQLQGTVDANDYDELVDDCTTKTSEDDEDESSKVFLPCGKIPTSNFNDTFTLTRDNGKYIKQSRADVAWSTDKRLYNDPGKSTKGIRVVDSFENPNFHVWARVAALPNFLKLYSIIDEDLDKGTYQLQVKNHYPTHPFDGPKLFQLSTVTWNGGPQWFLGGLYVLIGVLLLILACCVCVKSCFWPRKLGNIAYLDWDGH